jgi:hypothetical protein
MEILFFALLFAVFSAVVASSKGRSGFGWFLIGLFFGPFGLIVALLPSKATPAAAAPESPAPIDRNFSVSRARPITVRNEIHTTQRGTQMPKAQLEKFSWELDEDDDLSTAAVSVIDEPVPQGKTDKLGISLHSEALTEFVEKTETPITVGIQGEWGSGKTSLINSIFHHFKNHPNVKQIEVNAWEYSLLSAPEEALVKIVGKIITDLVGEDPKNELVKNLKKRAAYIFRGALRVSAHVALGSDAAEATDALLDPESPDIRQLREELEKVIDVMAEERVQPLRPNHHLCR